MKEASYIGENLKRLREKRDFSRRGLSIAAGLSAGHVGLIENGYVKFPGGRSLDYLARALGVSVDDLVEPNKSKVA